VYQLLQQAVTHFVFMPFVWFSLRTAIISLKSVNQLMSVMMKSVFFAVGAEFLNIIETIFGFKGLPQTEAECHCCLSAVVRMQPNSQTLGLCN
jgi:hypothetical protein